MKLHLLGTRGALVIGESRPEVGVYYRNQPPKEPRQRRVASDNDFLQAEDLAQAIDRNGDTIMNLEASCAAYATIEAALLSSRLGQPVEVTSIKSSTGAAR